MSRFGEEIDRILRKDGRDWTREESKAVEDLMRDGNRAELKQIRQQLRK